MDSKPKDLEIIYNLQWHSDSRHNEGFYTGSSATIIGLYDIPATTLNWSTFKSYLLKNSGIARDLGEDIEVSYNSGRGEVHVACQREFQIALYDFRRRARMGHIVTLNVSRISEGRMKSIQHDVETQYSTCCNSHTPPDWFLNYMTQFKKDFLEEVTCTVSAIVMNLKPHLLTQHHIRKPKPERLKKSKKPVPDINCDQGPKEDLKSLKIEGKLNRKLENLEHKTKKIIEKKLALLTKSSSTEEGASCNRFQSHTQPESEHEDDTTLMNAAGIRRQEIIPHLTGGETYKHEWQVLNNGKLPWTEATSLVYTWGSRELLPVNHVIPAPLLKPGEAGLISALVRVPFTPGEYECYWHFHHNKHRFGQWLGCQVIIVDPFDLRGNKSVLATTGPTGHYYRFKNTPDDTINQYPVGVPPFAAYPIYGETSLLEKSSQKLVGDADFKVADKKLHSPVDSNCSSDDDNQSIVSVAESSSSKGLPHDYVVVPIPECFQIDANSSKSSTRSTIVDADSTKKPESGEKTLENSDDNNNSEENSQCPKESLHKTDDASSSSSCKSEIVMVTLPENCEDTEEYAFVMVDGQKVSVPKKMIKAEYLQMLDQSEVGSLPPPIIADGYNYTYRFDKTSANHPSLDPSIGDSMPNLEPNNDLSHCSAAGSCFSEANTSAKEIKRMFMFPEDCPGFEVVNSEDKPTEVKNTIEKYEKVSWFPGDGPGYSVANSGPLNHPGCLFSAPVSKQPSIKNVESVWFEDVQNPFASVQQVIPNQPKVPHEAIGSEHTGEQRAPINVSSTVSETPRAPTPELNLNGAYIRAMAEQLPELPQGDSAAFETPHASAPELNASTAKDNIPSADVIENSDRTSAESERQTRDVPNSVHILPETLVSGAVNVASSAFHTARSVLNRIVPQEIPNLPNNDVPQQPGQWINGHWVSFNPATPREANLQALAEMGFWNRDLNATLLARYNDDLPRVVAELVQ